MAFFTYYDLVQSLLDMGGGAADDRALKTAKRAVQNAYRDLPAARRWSYFYQHYRLITDAPYSTGTVEFDYTGGTYELQLTLSSGTWPANAAYGKVLIDDVLYDVDERKSSTVLTLKAPLAPTADIAAGTSYTWFRDSYVLPSDLRSLDRLVELNELIRPVPVLPSDWLRQYSGLRTPSTPNIYVVTGDNDNNGRLSLKFGPAPDQAYNFDFIYQRRPRPLKVYHETTGAVSNTGTALTGSGTAFTQDMVGSVIRFYDASNVPTGLDGDYPYKDQRIIKTVTNATTAVLDAAPSTNYSAVKFSISDWADVEDGAMFTALQRMSEAEYAVMFSRDDAPQRKRMADQALLVAKENDGDRYFPSTGATYWERHKRTPGADDPAS